MKLCGSQASRCAVYGTETEWQPSGSRHPSTFPASAEWGTLRHPMKTSVRWMNDYLDLPASAQEQADFLTRAGFPLESAVSITNVKDGDTQQDIELTSNRGDCLCHLGLAREIAAVSGRRLKEPQPKVKAAGPAASGIISVTNDEKTLCPLYTARMIRGVKVGPSPQWLADRLIARGDIPRNNIVDASNFVLFELGQPTHAFDLGKLRGSKIIIRKARAKEPFLTIGEGASEVELTERDLVIADAERAVAIAGVKGGALTAVSNATTDILIEAATFDPATVRNTGRRLGIASDSQYRFERGVHPGQIEHAANRLVELILQFCGGTLCEGVVRDGVPIPPRRQVSMRCERCRKILGIEVKDQQMVEILARLGFEPKLSGGSIACTVPYPRLDIEREIDLIEEVTRMVGTDHLPINETIHVRVAPPQPRELARRAVNDALVGMGFVETVTHSLISEQAATPFLMPGMDALRVADERAKAEPVLRPSIIPSLLRVLAFNRDKGVDHVKLFETASVFAQIDGHHAERVNLAIVQPADSRDEGYRSLRGAVERLVHIVLGPNARMDVEPVDQTPWLQTDGSAVARINGQVLGTIGLISPRVAASFNLRGDVFVAEIGLPAQYDLYPPVTQAHALPQFPAIERDLSAIVDERLPWIEVKGAVDSLRLNLLEAIEYITAFRGKQIGQGKKSLTLRARFRATDRTLTHEEVDPQMQKVMETLKSKFAAEIRS